MTQITLYTVITGKRSCIVTYAQSPAYETKVFSGAFTDPGSASQEFKKTIKGKLEFLKEGVFQRKVGSLARAYQQDLLKLATWNNHGQHAHANKRKSPMPVSNEQYFHNLPANGLELAEAFLEDDLQILQENDLPVSETVVGLLTVHTLQEEDIDF